MLVDLEQSRAPVGIGDRHGHDLVLERALVDGAERVLGAVERPRIDVGAGQTHLTRGVLPHRDRHVERRRVRRLRMARRHPRHRLAATHHTLGRLRRRAQALRAAGDDDLVEAGANRSRRDLYRAQARRAVPVVGQTRRRGVPEPHRDVARDDAAALERFADDDVVDLGGRDPRSFDRGAHRDLRELERVDIDERSLARASDRCTGSGDDHSIGHGGAPLRRTVSKAPTDGRRPKRAKRAKAPPSERPHERVAARRVSRRATSDP